LGSDGAASFINRNKECQDMTTGEKAARRKKSLLELATELGNVSKACKIVGYSRQQFYEIRRNFQTYGAEGLRDRLPGPRGPHPNRVSDELEAVILSYSLSFPTHGPLRVAQQLALQNVQVSAGGVRGEWSRHKLLTRHDRLLRLERETRKRRVKLTDEQVRAGALQSGVSRAAYRDAPYRRLGGCGHLLRGTLKGVGRVYLQSVIDCHSRYAFGRLYTTKLPVTAVHVLNEDVLPFFEEHGAKVETILSDNGREFCGRPDRHPYELFLQLEGFEHRTTKVRRPQSNGFVERLHRTLLDEHFRIKGREKWYESVEEMQKHHYNRERTHQGRGMKGRTPYQAFIEGIVKQDEGQKQEPQEAA
jgi:transposase InsO family protein